MKKSLFILILCLLTFVGCQHKKSDLTEPNTSIQLIDSVWSFGQIQSSSHVISFTFQVKNTGQAPLVLRDLTTTCGCVKLKSYTHSPIPPNGLGYISVKFDPKKSAKGFVNKKVEIHSNAFNFVEATVTGYVE